jgi:hypothetical protein
VTSTPTIFSYVAHEDAKAFLSFDFFKSFDDLVLVISNQSKNAYFLTYFIHLYFYI